MRVRVSVRVKVRRVRVRVWVSIMSRWTVVGPSSPQPDHKRELGRQPPLEYPIQTKPHAFCLALACSHQH